MADAITGCVWVMGRSRKWNGKKKAYEFTAHFCHKMTAEDSTYCPKHKLFAQEIGDAQTSRSTPFEAKQRAY